MAKITIQLSSILLFNSDSSLFYYVSNLELPILGLAVVLRRQRKT